MEVRQLDAGDVNEYRAIRLEALKTYPESYGSTYAQSAARPLSSFTDMIKNNVMFGVFCNKSLSGIACLVSSVGAQDSHVGHVYQMYVQTEHQGRGLGAKLLEAIFAYAQPLVVQIHLGVGSDNLPALKLYEKAGFEIYGTEPRALRVSGKYIDEHLMVKFLDRQETK